MEEAELLWSFWWTWMLRDSEMTSWSRRAKS